MTPMPLLISLGSNSGGPAKLAEAAVLLRQAFGKLTLSSPEETAPLQGTGPNYFNAVALAQTELPASEVKRLLRTMETRLGRDRSTPDVVAIDLDLLAYGNLVDASLKLPSRDLAERPFCLLPAARLAPDFIHPTLGISLKELAYTRRTHMNEIHARHGIICSMPHDPFGYFGWPSVARAEDGTLYAVASGFRHQHVCPWGRTVLCKSTDNGESWSAPTVINNTPLDDRDAGIVPLPGNRLAVTWFTSNTQYYCKRIRPRFEPEFQPLLDRAIENLSDETRFKWSGSWIRISCDGVQWGELLRAPVNTPHGFIILKDGTWLYLGKQWFVGKNPVIHQHNSPIVCARSTDEGKSWECSAPIELPDGYDNDNAHEPHAVELPDGTLFGAIRYHNPFNILFTQSKDGGRTWSKATDPNIAGSPPHLLVHSSGKLICTYGYRKEPFGQRAIISEDNGKSWSAPIILRDDGPSVDLGYPCSIELPDGDILTVYYQLLALDENASLLYTKWRV